MGLFGGLAGAVTGEVVGMLWLPAVDGLLYGAGLGGVVGGLVGAIRGWMTNHREVRAWLRASFRR
jgi:hypothetical protein